MQPRVGVACSNGHRHVLKKEHSTMTNYKNMSRKDLIALIATLTEKGDTIPSSPMVTFKDVGGLLMIVDSSGNPVGNKLYPTLRGARQAASKAGLSYEGAKAETPKIPGAPKRPALTNEQIVSLYAHIMKEVCGRDITQKYDPSTKRDNVDWKRADTLAYEGGFGEKEKGAFFALKRTFHAIRAVEAPSAPAAKTSEAKAMEAAERAADAGKFDNALADELTRKLTGGKFDCYRKLRRAAKNGTENARELRDAVRAQVVKAA